MDFLGIGPGEMFFILVLALILFGPRRLPEIGRTLGKTVRELRQVSEGFSSQLREELDALPAIEAEAANDHQTGAVVVGNEEQESGKLEG